MSSDFDQYYVRIRGRISGPFDLQRLRGMKSRGVLSRVHEVSTDRTRWAPAGSVYGLFDEGGAADHAPAAGGFAGEDLGASFDAPEAMPAGDDWYYSSEGRQDGPVTAAELRQMFNSGRLTLETQVWRAGRASWSPARDVDELGLTPPPPAVVVSHPATGPSGGRLGLVLLLLVIVAAAVGGGLFVFRDDLFGDPLVVGNIESVAASQRISQSVGLVVSGWKTTSADGKHADLDYVLGGPFDGPYERAVDGDTPVFTRLRPEETVGVLKTADRFEKVDGGFRSLPESGMCVIFKEGDSRMVHALGGSGTCFMVTADGYALTNRHVVEDAYNLQQAHTLVGDITRAGGFQSVKPSIWVFFEERQHDAEIVHVSEKYDLAILKIDGRQAAPHFALAKQVDIEHLPRGNKVYVLGFPGASRIAMSDQELKARHAREEVGTLVSAKFSPSDFQYTQTDGAISKIASREEVGVIVQHNADINPGNSGGPLVTRDGRVQAINTATASGASGIHFSIAIDQLRKEINDYVKPAPLWK